MSIMLKPQDLLISCKILSVELRSSDNTDYSPSAILGELEGVIWEIQSDSSEEAERELGVIEEFLAREIKLQSKWNYRQLASELFISLSEANKAVGRAIDAGLLIRIGSDVRVNRVSLEKFIRFGAPVAFSAKAGAVVRGIPTAYAAPIFKEDIAVSSDLPPVWPYPLGKVRGMCVDPLYKSAAKAALIDAELYSLLAIIDIFRIGDSRSQKIAGERLSKTLEGQ